MRHTHVFDDPSGRRWKLFVRAAIAVGVVVSALVLVLLSSVFVVPALPANPRITTRLRSALKTPSSSQRVPVSHRSEEGRTQRDPELQHMLGQIAGHQRRTTIANPAPRREPIVAAFYAPWQANGLSSLRANSAHLTHLMPAWLALSQDGSGIDTHDWDPGLNPHNVDALELARRNKLRVLPVFTNAARGHFDPVRVHALLADTTFQDTVADDLLAWLRRTGCQGINLDFENLDSGDRARLPGFLHQLRARFRPHGLLVTADLESNTPSQDAGAIAAECDFVVLMAYEEHSSISQPGPIASLGWTRSVVEGMLERVPADKLVLGLGSYAYDWSEGRPPAKSLSYEAAMITARERRATDDPRHVVKFPANALNATFQYVDSSGAPHEVWMLDAVSAANQLQVTRHLGLAGGALWVLGSEDPGLWNFFDRERIATPVAFSSLAKIPSPTDILFEGRGEVLSVASHPAPGFRAIDVDSSTGIATGLNYVTFASPYVIHRSGYRDHTIALTFDDGPSSQYTARILDELHSLGVRATFFVIGENAKREPYLLQRILRDGHEVGNHTFTHPNLSRVSRDRVRYELNATQRVLQATLGRSTAMFRAPYNSDAEAAIAEEVGPILEADRLGYITIGEYIDPKDWQLTERRPDGTTVERTAEDIAQSVIDQVHRAQGCTVLLHDGGGDRTLTVEALRQFVPMLRREGYTFVTVSGLLGVTSAEVNPPIATWERLVVGGNRVTLGLLFMMSKLMRGFFMVAIVLGVLRALWVISFAIAKRMRERAQRFNGDYRPTVSVLVAAFNEQAVICWTIHSVLDGDDPPLEVIVVDDGSTDDTVRIVTEEFDADRRVRIVRQANAGKAAALNRALDLAKGEILICLDADTIFDRRTIARLVHHLADPRVAAVAGNVKVGNQLNLWTRWQMIEYVSGQNLDRRAYATLHAITVVPGAVGAWRRDAVIACGGFAADTLAEDMDLTWRIRRAGWRVANAPDAFGYTEAPDTVSMLFRQRFRWSLGTLQCLWKHRDALGRFGWFGCVLLPSMWVFQVLYQTISPIVDLQMALALLGVASAWLTRGFAQSDWGPLPQAVHALEVTFAFYAFFFGVELISALIAFRLGRERMKPLWWLFAQRFAYRQLLYAAMLKSLSAAIRGSRTGWGKLERKGTALAEPARANAAIDTTVRVELAEEASDAA